MISTRIESPDTLEAYYRQGVGGLYWPHIFSLPGWTQAWWSVLGDGFEPLVVVARDGDVVVGIAPLKHRGQSASLIGDASVCDYLDLVVLPGRERDFAASLLDTLSAHKIKSLAMGPLRPDSIALGSLAGLARARGLAVSCSPLDVSYELMLPATWEGYLASLEGKQRHEVERKLKKLAQVGEVIFGVRRNSDVLTNDMELFLSMMMGSRRDKAGFLTPEMRRFFGAVARAMSGYGLLRLGFLKLGGLRVAAVLYFDYNDRIYLYNSGYLPEYAAMSVGLASKLYCIRQAVAEKKRVFDFLKGAESYKSRLGGREVPLSTCCITLS